MSQEEIKRVCDEFIRNQVTMDTFILTLTKEVLHIKDRPTAIRVAQALFFGMVPEGGDGE